MTFEKDEMNKKKLKSIFDWQHWTSAKSDLKSMKPLLVSRILFNTLLINEFEHALLRLKNEDCVWGPVHTSVGQEALAAATMAALTKGDKIAGSHRAHHQFLAKSLNYVLEDRWNPVKDQLPEPALEVLQKTMAEIMGLAPGYCGGRGGSMHLKYADAGVIGTNAIVGGGIPLATGAAYAEQYTKTGNVVVCFFGDGAINQGVFHESCNLAGIWNLPIIYFVENNLYGVGTRADISCAVKDLSIRADSYQMDARIVDGNDVAAIYQTVKDVADGIRKGNRPCVIEAKCYRHYHHAGDQPGSTFGYRTKKEEKEWLAKDALTTYPRALKEAKLLTKAQIEKITQTVKAVVAQAVDFCTTHEKTYQVREELWPKPETVDEGIRSAGSEFSEIEFSALEDYPTTQEITYSDAIAAVTGRWLEKDDKTVVLGEEIASFGGGAYGATKKLPALYPDRVRNTPITEAGFIGLACGAAMSGMRPVAELMFPDFALVAADQLFNQIGKARHMYGGKTDLPLVVRTRIAVGCGYGGQHSMDPVALFSLFPGWRILAPSNAADYVGLFNTAMQSLDPVLMVEHHALYTKKYEMPKDNLDYFIPFGKAKLVAEGKDVTLVGYSSIIDRLKIIGEQLKSQGISADIIDLRSLDLPSIDYEMIGQSLKKTGALAIIEEAPTSNSIGGRIAAEVYERFYDELDGPVACVTSKDVPNSVSRVLEAEAMLKDEAILETAMAVANRRWR
jgi:2-oxoisovalerate dehydrogenase E1 component